MAAADAGTSAGGTTTGHVKRVFDFSASDFATIVKTTAYVDKSLMIRDFYYNIKKSSRIMITAPRRFGKSTNMDMVKRFFEIEVDEHGIAKLVQTTNNYKLFKDYNLEICKDIGFVNEHFGKYPVIHIDFKPLGSVDGSAKMFSAFKIIILNSFNQHSYILQHSLKKQVFSGITGFDENDFRTYVSDGITKDVDEVNLANSFKHLSKILKRFFGKKVFVLIDSYDAFLDSPLCKNNTHGNKMISFVGSSVSQLLQLFNCVEQVFITGVIPVVFPRFFCVENPIIKCYHFLDSHPFTKYYGLTSSEVDTVLSKVIECGEERRDIKNKINDYYNAYETRNRDIHVYNVWSVLQYVSRRTVKSYWCERSYINKFVKCLKIEPIRQKLVKLLLGNELQLDTSKLLVITPVLEVKRMIATGMAKHLSIEVELFFILFYHFGYLSAINDLDMGVVCVNIASEEIKYELAKAVFVENRELYSSRLVNDILSALDEFCPDANELYRNLGNKYGMFCKSLYFWIRKNNFNLTRFLECFFMNLAARTNNSQVIARKLGPDGPTAVLLKNKFLVAICVTCDGGTDVGNAHNKVTNDGRGQHIFDAFNRVRGKVIITVGLANPQIEIAYSYYFTRRDDLQRVFRVFCGKYLTS